MLLAFDLQLLFEGAPSLFILDQLLKRQTIHHLAVVTLGIVDFQTVDLSRVGVDHLVPDAGETTLGEDDFSFELLAVMAELESTGLVSVLDLELL